MIKCFFYKDPSSGSNMRVGWGQKLEERVSGGLIRASGKGNGEKWTDLRDA